MKEHEAGKTLRKVTLERLGFVRLRDFYRMDITQEQRAYVGTRKTRLIRRTLESFGRGRIWIICRDGEACGYLCLWIDPRIDQFTIAPFIIDQNHQREGIGRAALGIACGKLFNAGAKTVRLAVHPENRAGIAFYKGEGFTFTGKKWGPTDHVMGLEKEVFLKQGGRQE